MAWARDLPDEVVEQILLFAWTSDDLQDDRRWLLYCSVTNLCRRWRDIMLAARQSVVFLRTSNDLVWYHRLLRLSGDIPSRALAHGIHVAMKCLPFAADFVANCSFLDLDVGLIAGGRRCSTLSGLRYIPPYPSLSHVGLTWAPCRPLALPPFHYDAVEIPTVGTVRSLSLHYPAENDIREFARCVPILSGTFPNVITLRLRGPVPLTYVLAKASFPKLTHIILDDHPMTSVLPTAKDSNPSTQITDGAQGLGDASSQRLSQTMLWVITAAVKNRGKGPLEHILVLGRKQQPNGWDRMTKTCLRYGVTLEYRAVYPTD